MNKKHTKLQKTYLSMEDALDNASHRIDMVLSSDIANIGRYISPTGSGKSEPQAEIFIRKLGKYKIGIHKSPRIALTNQLNVTHVNYFEKRGKLDSFVTTNYHSGDTAEIGSDDLEFDLRNGLITAEDYENALYKERSIESISQSPEDIRKFIITAWKNNKTPIFYTTYHSNTRLTEKLKLVGFDETDMCDINDEAHYLTQQGFSQILDTYLPKFQYFFTATEKHSDSDSGLGMNNIERFGKILYILTVNEAIKLGIILPIKPLVIENNVELTTAQISNKIDDISLACLSATKKELPDMAPKLLISVKSKNQLRKLIASKKIQNWHTNDSNRHILTYHSDTTLLTHNGKKKKREEIDNLRIRLGETDNVELIIVHYDILAEGIDIPGLTSVLILRNMSKSKFWQTIGRVVRKYRKNISYKPYGLLFVPNFSIEDKDLVESFKDNITLLNEEGYIPNELMELYSPKGDDSDLDDVIKDDKNVRNLADKIKLDLHFRELMKLKNLVELKTSKELVDEIFDLFEI
jgi:hypothetical protein